MPTISIVAPEPLYLPARYVQEVAALDSAQINVTLHQDFPTDMNHRYARGKDAEIILSDPFGSYPAELLEKWPRLKALFTTSVGTDHIDLAYCRQKNITVVNFPGYNARAVAELAFADLISLLRKVPSAHQHVKSGGWKFGLFQGSELHGKVLGVIGAGSVGREMINIGQGLNMEIICHTKHPSEERAAALKLETFYSLREVLKAADFVMLATPLNESTKYLINEQRLTMMKKGAYLINVARWQVVDPEALARALYEEHLAGAALDFVGPEPFNVRHASIEVQEMVNSANVIVTPHLGGITLESDNRLGERLVSELKKQLALLQ